MFTRRCLSTTLACWRCCWGMGWSYWLSWSPYSHQSGYQGIRNSASRSRIYKPLWWVGGIPCGEVYSRCLGLMEVAWCLVEGPSIQLGRWVEKENPSFEGQSGWGAVFWLQVGLLLGLVAFNAPIAGLSLICAEEVYHHFSRFFWISTLAASLTANFISLTVFGQTPLHMPKYSTAHLSQYWIYLFLGALF